MSTGFNTFTHTLAAPITIGEQLVTSLTLSEPTVEMLEELEDAGFGAPVFDKDGNPVLDEKGNQKSKTPTIREMRRTIEILAGQPADSLKPMHRQDFNALMEAAGPLLGSSSDTTGPEPSASAAPAPTASAMTEIASSVTSPTS